MPLPALDLDTRRWADLVDEARALVPRLAPDWTDHNVHDPGITLIELLAYLVEQDIYRVGRVPERHRRKFLRLIGFSPEPARAARGAVAFQLRTGTGPIDLPAGLAVGAPELPFRTVSAVTVSEARIVTVQSYDGSTYVDATHHWQNGLPFAALGADPSPAHEPALVIGFDPSPEVGQTVSLWLGFDGTVAGDRTRLERELADAVEQCPDSQPHSAPNALVHHSLRTVWEYHDGTTWKQLDAEDGEVVDETRALSFDGCVRITLPGAMSAAQVGAVADAHGYLRCRVTAGEPDCVPVVLTLAVNAVAVEQRAASRQTFALAPGPPPAASRAPVVGRRGPLALELDQDGAATSLAFGAAATGPEAFVLDYRPSTQTAPGSLTVTLGIVGRGDGRPGQCLELPDGPVADGEVELWTDKQWTQCDDLDAVGPTDAAFRLEPLSSILCFGDGERGRTAPAGTALLAAYDVTTGQEGNGRLRDSWRIAGVDDLWNAAVTGTDPAALETALEVMPVGMSAGGADAETLAHAEGRAAAAVWAHERLLELCPAGAVQTLDQVPRASVEERVAPARAVTAFDFERLALAVPAVDVRRARAWPGIDPRDPCLQAPGTVTVVVLAGIPRTHPRPTDALLNAVWRFLNRRRLIGTRLRVAGPTYVDVSVEARIQAARGADVATLPGDVSSALDRFLDPLHGGPNGVGWPFGRDVYRTEILERIAGVPGVDHVLEVTLLSGSESSRCDNVCVEATALVRAGRHRIEVEEP